MEYNGKALADLDSTRRIPPAKVLVPAGAQLPGFAMLRDDGTTSCGCWIYAGAWTQAGNQMARRDNADPYGIGQTLNWAWAWPVNRRILYNRASADPVRQAVEPEAALHILGRQGLERGGRSGHARRRGAGRERQSVHHDGRRRGAAVRADRHGRRTVARTLRAVRVAGHDESDDAATTRRRSPIRPRACSRATWRHSASRRNFRTPQRPIASPSISTSGPSTCDLNAITQPQQFVEIGEDLAKEKGIKHGDIVKVRSNRGQIQCVVCVTKRIKALDCDGTKVHTVGIPAPLGLHGRREGGLSRQHADALRRRRQHADAGIQGVHRQHRESVAGERHVIAAIARPQAALRDDDAVAVGARRRSKSPSSSTSRSASAARRARWRAANGTTCATRSDTTSASTTIPTDLTAGVVDGDALYRVRGGETAGSSG